MLYYRGLGVPKKFETALKFFAAAARGGDPAACNNVAKCFEEGRGTERNTEKALDMYKLGADNGSREAIYSFGYLILKEALSNQIGVRKNDNDNLLILGKVGEYEEYVLDYNAKLKEGVKYLRMAVEYGVADAAYQLARLYEQGIGVPYDISSAYSHYLWAAEIGHGRSAMCAANILYHNTISKDDVMLSSSAYKKNMVTVAKLYLQAAKSGIVMSMNAYALLVEDGTGTENGKPNIHEAAKWYLAAAEEGYFEAAGNLGFLLSTNERIMEIITVDNKVVTTHDIRIWLESLLTSPLIQPDQRYIESVNKLKCAESKQDIYAGQTRTPVKKFNKQPLDQKEEKSSYHPKELHYSILFGENANAGSEINFLNPTYGTSSYDSVPDQPSSSFSDASFSWLQESKGDFCEEKKSDEITEKKLEVDGNVSSVFSLSSTTPQVVQSDRNTETIMDNIGSEVEDIALSKSVTIKKSNDSVVTNGRPSSITKGKKSHSKESVFNGNENRMKQNLEKLKSKKSEYFVGEQ